MALLACQPRPGPRDQAACPGRPEPGEVQASEIVCGAQLLADGEGRGSDLAMASHWLRAVIRHPESALTLTGVGGGTLIDLAPWGYRDRLHEVVPLVDGGWLEVAELDLLDDGYRVAGPVVALPDQPLAEEGQWREVSVHLDPDGPWIRFEGADGLWIHPAGDFALLDGQLVEAVVYGHHGSVVEDLGGAVRVDATRLLVAPSAEAWAWLDPGQPLAGVAEGAERLVLYRGDEVVGRIDLDEEGAFDTLVSADVDGVRAEAAGHAPSPRVAPGDDLALSLGPAGALEVTVPGARPVRVDWSDLDGRSGVAVLPPGGGVLDLGAGQLELTLSAGPAVVPRTLRAEVPPGERETVGVTLQPRFDPGARVLASVAWPGGRSRTFRGTDATALALAAGAGISWVAVTPPDDVAAAEVPQELAGHLWARSGVLLSSWDGWTVAAWPWSPTPRQGGHGAPDVDGLAPAEALAAARGGPGSDRTTVVDLPWLEAVGLPWEVDPHPDLVLLDGPGPDGPAGGAWDRWFTWLDHGGDLVPAGPRVWVDVADPTLFGRADVELALLRGNVVATTGPLVTLAVAGVVPGEVVVRERVEPNPSFPVSITVASGERPVDHVALLGDGGVVLRQWEVDGAGTFETTTTAGRWRLAVAWSDDGTTWAATGPVWFDLDLPTP